MSYEVCKTVFEICEFGPQHDLAQLICNYHTGDQIDADVHAC